MLSFAVARASPLNPVLDKLPPRREQSPQQHLIHLDARRKHMSPLISSCPQPCTQPTMEHLQLVDKPLDVLAATRGDGRRRWGGALTTCIVVKVVAAELDGVFSLL